VRTPGVWWSDWGLGETSSWGQGRGEMGWGTVGKGSGGRQMLNSKTVKVIKKNPETHFLYYHHKFNLWRRCYCIYEQTWHCYFSLRERGMWTNTQMLVIVYHKERGRDSWLTHSQWNRDNLFLISILSSRNWWCATKRCLHYKNSVCNILLG